MSTTKNISLTVDEKAHGYAKIYASLLGSEYQRKRSYASIVALYAFINSLEKTDNNVQKSMTLFRNPIINEQYEVTDLYVNNWHLDVRVITEGDSFLIPKIHFLSNILPDFYVVIKTDTTLNSAELIGFLDTSSFKKSKFNDNYYSVPLTELINYAEFLDRIRVEKVCDFSLQEHEFLHANYISFMDNELDAVSKDKILQHLFKCPDCRTEFCCFTGFEMVSCNMKNYPELLEDNTLEIIGAQQVEDDEFEGKEEIIYFDDNQDNDLQQDEQNDSKDDESNSQEPEDLSDIENDAQTEINNDQTETEAIIQPELQSENDIINEIETQNETENENKNENENENDVSELLDELFNEEDASNIEQENLQKAQFQDKVNEKNNELEIVEDNTEENEKEDNLAEIKNVDSDDSELLVIEDDTGELIDSVDEIKPIEESEDSASNIQEVITDYDEMGKPVYSYVENVSPENAQTLDSEIELIEESVVEPDGELNEEQSSNDIAEVNDIDEIVPIEDEQSDIKEDNNNAESDYNDIKYIDSQDDYDYETENNYINTDVENEVNSNEKEVNSQSSIYENLAIQQNNDIETQDESSFNNHQKEIHFKNEEDEEVNEEELNSDDIEIQYEEDEKQDMQQEDDIEDEETDDEEYEDDIEYEEKSDTNGKKSSNSLKVLLLVLFLTIAAGGVFLFMNNKNNTASNSIVSDNSIEMTTETENNVQNQETIPSQGSIDVDALNEQDLLKVKPRNNADVNKVMANAFSEGGNGVSLRGINWMCTAELFTDKTFKDYLQNLDSVLKLNLRKNILNATDTTEKDSVTAKLAIDNNGELQKVIISDSSGSEQIDDIVLQSIKESFVGEKSPIITANTLKSDMYYLKVVIKL